MSIELYLILCDLIPTELEPKAAIKYALIFTVTWLIYRYLVLPLNWTKDLKEVGYSYLNKGVYSKRDGLRIARNGRNLGKLPPVYPNGWFMLAESSDILVNQAQHITALGVTKHSHILASRAHDADAHDVYSKRDGLRIARNGRNIGKLPPVYPNGWFMLAESSDILINQVVINFDINYNSPQICLKSNNWGVTKHSHILASRAHDVYSKRDGLRIARNGRNIGKLPPVYPNGWFMLAESSDILINQAQHITALGENFVLFRSPDGQCHVLDAYCPHVGANMGIGGKVYGDCIECPFHHWRFSGLTGKCTSVPYAKKVPNFAQVKCWNVYEVNDMIFVWYHAENEPPTWHPRTIDSIEERKFIYRGRNQYLVNCHIQDIPENGSDIWHFNAVHGASILTGSDIYHHEAVWCKFFRHNWSARWEPCSEPNKKHVGVSRLSHFISLFGVIKLASMDVDIEQIGPGYVILSMSTTIGPMVVVQTVTPIEPMIQRVVHRFYSPIYLALYATITLVSESIMIERDIMIWNHKKFAETPLLLREDRTVLQYRRWFAQFYSEHSPKYNTKRERLDW